MKKSRLLLALLALALLCSCSDKQKAERLAKSMVVSSLAHPESYRLIGCEVDSAYEGTPETFRLYISLIEMQNEIAACEPIMKRVEHNFAHYDSLCKDDKKRHIADADHENLREMAKNDFYKRRDEYVERVNEMHELLEKYEKVVGVNHKYAIGWQIKHSYSAKGEDGKTHRYNSLVVTDFDFKKVIMTANDDSVRMLLSPLRPIRRLPKANEVMDDAK